MSLPPLPRRLSAPLVPLRVSGPSVPILVTARATPFATNRVSTIALSNSIIFLIGYPPLLSFACPLYVQRILMVEVSQSHGGKPPFWSGNCVGASPYATAFSEYFPKRLTGQLRRILLPRTRVNKGKKRKSQGLVTKPWPPPRCAVCS